MLTLTGPSAFIFHVAKGALASTPEISDRLRAAIAVFAGLPSPQDVRNGDLLRHSTALVDELAAAGLMGRPTQDLLGYITMVTYHDTVHRTSTSIDELLLGGLFSALRGTAIRDKSGARLIEWESQIPEEFEAQALALLSPVAAA